MIPLTLFLSLSLWRDISVIWLSLFCFIGLAIPLVLVYFVVRGMDAALQKTRIGLLKAQTFTTRAKIATERASVQVAQPVIRAYGMSARWQRVMQALDPTKPRHAPRRTGRHGPDKRTSRDGNVHPNI